MSFPQFILFLSLVVAIMIVFDWILSKTNKTWKPMPWESTEEDNYND